MALGQQRFYNILDHTNSECGEWVVVNWNLGNRCNYKCSYCPPVLNNGSFGWNDYDVVQGFVDAVISHYAGRKIYFEFTGGEVTLWRDLTRLAQYVKKQGHAFGFISNGSRTLRWWQQNKQYFDHVCLSYHSEFGDAEHFYQVVQELASVCRTHVNIMLHTEQDKFDTGVELAHRVVEDIPNISIALQPLIVDFGSVTYQYTSEQQSIIDDQWNQFARRIRHDKKYMVYRGSMDMLDTVNGLKEATSAQRFIGDGTNNWKGWDCWAGVEQIIVDFDGSVWRGWCRVGGALGFIRDPEHVRFPVDPIRCNKSFCHCNFDIMCKKVLPPEKYEVIDE